jgi:hypothetical protein
MRGCGPIPERPITRLAQVEEPGLRGGEAGGRGRLGPLMQGAIPQQRTIIMAS